MGFLAGYFFENRRILALSILLILVSGISSLWILSRQEDPLIRPRAANVTTLFPGAEADQVEAQVTEKLEERLLELPEIKRLRSQSRVGASFISIELRDDILDAGTVWSKVRGKLEDAIADLPEGATRPEFDDLDIAAYAWIAGIAWSSDQPPTVGMLKRLARELRDELRKVPGTKTIDLFGDPREEVLVDIDSVAAATAGLSADEIARQLSFGDVKSSAGMIRNPQSETVVKLANQFEDLEQIGNTPIFAQQPGKTFTLRDFATIRRTVQSPPASVAIIEGRRCVVLGVMLRTNQRIDQWFQKAEPTWNSFAQRLPQGIELLEIMRQDTYVATRMNSLATNLIAGAAAVAAVTLVLMGWRSCLIVTITLPLASLCVVAAMRFLAIPIHQMSITGLVVAMGLLIDNAIIAVDEVSLLLRKGKTPKEAAIGMASMFFAPLTASTITTALAFAPIAMMEGPAGEFVGSIAVTVIFAIVSSLILALTVTPAITGMLATWRTTTLAGATELAKESFLRQLWQGGVRTPRLTQQFRRFLELLLRNPILGLAFGLIFPLMGFAVAMRLNEQFFPPADRNQFYLEVELSPAASILQTEEVVSAIRGHLMTESAIRQTAWFLGESAPPFYYNVIARRKNSPNYAQAIVTLKDNVPSRPLIIKLQESLNRDFPQARILARQLEQGPPFAAPIELRLFGPDLDALRESGQEIHRLASEIPGVIHVREDLNESRPVASLRIDASPARWAGLDESQIANQLFARLDGLYAGSIIESVEQIPVRVRIDASQRESIERLMDTELAIGGNRNNSDSQSSKVPVSTVASLTIKPQRAVITRYNGRRMNEVQIFIQAGLLAAPLAKKLTERMEMSGFQMPSGYTLEFGGETSERNEAVARLMANVSVLMIAIVVTLVLALGSFRLTLLIACIGGLSVGLGLGSLWLFGFPFGFMAIIGTMGLIGVAINDSIVVLSGLQHNPRAMMRDIDATVDSVLEVSRHVLATTFTTAFGFLPLVVGGGEFWPPMAITIGFGVMGATVLSLTFVPTVFHVFYATKPHAESNTVRSVAVFPERSAPSPVGIGN